MSSEETNALQNEERQNWPVLDAYERRVLGVLVEKAKTTPDAYPLSLNGVVTGCNQKSNRDPIMTVSELDAETTLEDLQKKGLAIRITGSGRVERWRHNLYDAWNVGKVELAILAELLLRGPQTEGELRQRAGRMEPIDELDTLREQLRKLSERGLVVYLIPPGRRGTTVTHGFHDEQELLQLKKSFAGDAGVEGKSDLPAPRTKSASGVEMQSAHIVPVEPQKSIADLQAKVASLEQSVNELRAELKQLKESLGA